jgi:hypothetical protein
VATGKTPLYCTYPSQGAAKGLHCQSLAGRRGMQGHVPACIGAETGESSPSPACLLLPWTLLLTMHCPCLDLALQSAQGPRKNHRANGQSLNFPAGPRHCKTLISTLTSFLQPKGSSVLITSAYYMCLICVSMLSLGPRPDSIQCCPSFHHM